MLFWSVLTWILGDSQGIVDFIIHIVMDRHFLENGRDNGL